MCIAICQAPGKYVTDKELDMCYKSNPDGCGYAYIKDIGTKKARICISKTLDYETFLADFRRDEEENPNSPFLIHLRATTIGKTDLNNCHPFRINKGQVFCHNGTIKKVPEDKTGGMSDTAMFNKTILKHLPYQWEQNAGIRRLVEEFLKINVINDGKVCVLNLDGSFTIFNEKEGHWFRGIWWSNDYYKKERASKPVYYGGYYTSKEDEYYCRYQDKKRILKGGNVNKVVDKPKEIGYTTPYKKNETKLITCNFCDVQVVSSCIKQLSWTNADVCVSCYKDLEEFAELAVN